MPRPIDERGRVLGPYPPATSDGYWKVTTVDPGAAPAAERSSHRYFATKEEADAWKKIEEKNLEKLTSRSIYAALTEYRDYLIDKGNKEISVNETVRRVRLFFPVPEHPLASVTPQKAKDFYAAFSVRTFEVGPPKKRRKKKVSVDFQRNALSQVKTFMRWCVAQGWLTASPVEHVKGVGKRRKGKPQLTGDEARKFLTTALRLAEKDAGALGAAMLLLMGLRQSEVFTRNVRDLDMRGTVLRITDAKTKAGEGYVEIPEVLQPFLLEHAKGRKGGEPLFPADGGGYHTKAWLRTAVRRVCKAAKVPQVPPHGLRGTFSSVAHRAGVASHVVAAQLGHASTAVTLDSYTSPAAVRAAKQGKVLRMMRQERRAFRVSNASRTRLQ